MNTLVGWLSSIRTQWSLVPSGWRKYAEAVCWAGLVGVTGYVSSGGVITVKGAIAAGVGAAALYFRGHPIEPKDGE